MDSHNQIEYRQTESTNEPAVVVPNVPTDAKVFTKNQLDIAAFFGTAIAAAFLLMRNYQTMGEPEKGKTVLWQGVLLVLGLLVLLLIIPDAVSDNISGILMGLVYVFIAEYYFRQNQKAEIDALITEGVPVRSGWKVFGIILISLVLAVILVLIVTGFATLLGF